jgi:hypothetical protein
VREDVDDFSRSVRSVPNIGQDGSEEWLQFFAFVEFLNSLDPFGTDAGRRIGSHLAKAAEVVQWDETYSQVVCSRMGLRSSVIRDAPAM